MSVSCMYSVACSQFSLRLLHTISSQCFPVIMWRGFWRAPSEATACYRQLPRSMLGQGTPVTLTIGYMYKRDCRRPNHAFLKVAASAGLSPATRVVCYWQKVKLPFLSNVMSFLFRAAQAPLNVSSPSTVLKVRLFSSSLPARHGQE